MRVCYINVYERPSGKITMGNPRKTREIAELSAGPMVRTYGCRVLYRVRCRLKPEARSA